MTVVGRVAGLWRYPVKSMAGEELDGVEVSWHGLAGDRRWAFIRDGQVRGGFPWLTLVRPNLLVDAPRGEFPEDGWVGRVLRVGGLRMRLDQRDRRCVMITIDPVTLRRDPAVLRAVARERDARFGVYGTTVAPGRVAVGDPVELEP